jgi:hypothetical protein
MDPKVSIIFVGLNLSKTIYSGNFFPPFILF